MCIVSEEQCVESARKGTSQGGRGPALGSELGPSGPILVDYFGGWFCGLVQGWSVSAEQMGKVVDAGEEGQRRKKMTLKKRGQERKRQELKKQKHQRRS